VNGLQERPVDAVVGQKARKRDGHCSIDLVDSQAAMYLFHGAASILHGIQCFLIDVRGFYAIDLLFDLCNLCGGLLQATFVGLFPPQGSFRSYHPGLASKINARGRWDLRYAILAGQATAERGRLSGGHGSVPILFVVTFFRATASCSAICVSKCLSRFCSMSSCCRSVNMAFLGASFLFCAAAPPNQPHIAAVYKGVTDMVGSGSKDVLSSQYSEEAKIWYRGCKIQ
jgi:hypothetical protein